MASTKPRARKSGRLWQVLYELGLLLACLIAILSPIHNLANVNTAVDEVVDSSHVLATVPVGIHLEQGDEFPVFRFSFEWPTEIGKVRVERIDGSKVLFGFDPKTFKWPMGRHGLVTDSRSDGSVKVNLGSNLAFARNDALDVYRGRNLVNRVLLSDVGATSSTGQITDSRTAVLAGDRVSEFAVPTQILVFKSPAVAIAEVVALCAVLALYVGYWTRFRHSPLVGVGSQIRRLGEPLRTKNGQTIVSLVVGVPLVWLASRFLSLALVFIAERSVLFIFRFVHASPSTEVVTTVLAPFEFLSRYPAILFVLLGVLYVGVLFRTHRSPLAVFWDRIKFRGGPLKGMPPGAARDFATWMLHLLIAYAFAYSILSFIGPNLNALMASAWAGSNVHVVGKFDAADPSGSLEFFRGAFASAGYMLTHAPHLADTEAFFGAARYFLFTITIMGCLIGYGHSILGYLWGKKIRNLDFTLPGWVTNGICYGPLLGAIVWQIYPRMPGDDPTFGSGPLYLMDLGVELFLNILYVATIWNLGKMFGVMTDKGVRTTGFYSVVRHPSYTAEALMFVALELKGLTTGAQWLTAAGAYLFTYWLRSEREDVFMSASNPEFDAYKAATPYKYIPGIY